MSRFDRYLLSQLMILFGFFSLVLVSVYWVNRAVVLFDQLIADGHSAGVFLEFTMLTLPNVIGMVLPISTFAAVVYVINRLNNESELIVMQATGFSPWRLARPVVVFGLLVALFMLSLTVYLVPESNAQLKQRERDITASVSSRLLRDGIFLHPVKGTTFYIREITSDGELLDIFLSDRRDEEVAVTYTANKAYLLRDGPSTNLLMLNGLAQTLNYETNQISTTLFSDFAYDISGVFANTGPLRLGMKEMSIPDLLEQAETTTSLKTEARLREEMHSRLHEPLLCLAAALIGYSALMIGSFSRFGATRQILFAIFLLVLIKMVESLVTGPVRSSPSLWYLVYAPSVFAFVTSGLLLFKASQPKRRWMILGAFS